MINNLADALVLYLPDIFSSEAPVLATRSNLIAAAKAAAQWRADGPRATALVLHALHEQGMTFRQIEQETGIDHVTTQRMIRSLREDEL